MTNPAENSDGGLIALVMRCAMAVAANEPTVTISCIGKRPAGFPRGELLSAGANGSHNYAVDPIKTLAWVRNRMAARAANPIPDGGA